MANVATEERVCTKCSRSLPLAEFSRKGVDGYQTWCKPCFRANNARWRSLPVNKDRRRARDNARYAADPEGFRDRAYERNVLRRYGITLVEIAAMRTAQGERCFLCGVPFAALSQRPCVDHDHETGRVRGIVCKPCNTRLAWLENVGVSKVLAYLDREEARIG